MMSKTTKKITTTIIITTTRQERQEQQGEGEKKGSLTYSLTRTKRSQRSSSVHGHIRIDEFCRRLLPCSQLSLWTHLAITHALKVLGLLRCSCSFTSSLNFSLTSLIVLILVGWRIYRGNGRLQLLECACVCVYGVCVCVCVCVCVLCVCVCVCVCVVCVWVCVCVCV